MVRLLYTVHFSFSSISKAPKQLFRPCNYTTFRNNFKPSQMTRSSSSIRKKNYSPQSHKCTNSLQHLPITMNNNNIFHRVKLISLIKIFQWAQRCAWPKHTIAGKTGTAGTFSRIMQGLFLLAEMPIPAPQVKNNPRKLPRAVSLKRSSHCVTQSKILTKRSHAPL